MTIAVSTVPAVKKYLYDKTIEEMNNLGVVDFPWSVVYDAPGMYRPGDLIAISKVWDRVVHGWQMVGSGGTGWLKEEYQLEIQVDVWRPGESLQIQAYERAWQLTSVIENVIRTDPSMGNLVVMSRPERTRDSAEWAGENKGWVVTVVNRIYVLARI